MTLQMQCVRLSLFVLLTLFGSSLCQQAFAIKIKDPILVKRLLGPAPAGSEEIAFTVDTSGAAVGSTITTQIYVTISGYTDSFGTYHPFPGGPVTIALLNPMPTGETDGKSTSYDRNIDLFAALAAAGVSLPPGSTISYYYRIDTEVTTPFGTDTTVTIATIPGEQYPTPPDYKPKVVTGIIRSIIDPPNSTIGVLLPDRIGILLTTADTSIITIPIAN